jgi:hypothetical protein
MPVHQEHPPRPGLNPDAVGQTLDEIERIGVAAHSGNRGDGR